MLILSGAVCFAQQTPPQPASPTASAPNTNSTNTAEPVTTTATNPPPAYQVGGSVQPPVLIHSVVPKYSKQARKAKFSGQVVVALIVDKDGMPQKVHVLRGVGMGLDEEALEAVQQYRFKPAMQNGKPVAVYLNVQVNFQILSRY